MKHLSEQEFLKLTEKGNLVPVFKEILGDLDTPVSAYYKIANDAKYSFLLESVEGEEKVARYSFLAHDPELIISAKGQDISLTRLKGKSAKTERLSIKQPLDYIRDLIKEYRPVDIPGMPRFIGGLVGYIGYDAVRFIEHLPDQPEDDLKLPDMLLMLAKDCVIFDHRNHSICFVNCVQLSEKMTRPKKVLAYQKAMRAIDRLIVKIKQPLQVKSRRPSRGNSHLAVRSNFTAAEFEKIVRLAKKEITKGEIIQAVLSQRFELDLKIEPFQLYRMLRAVNPSPYMYYLNFSGIQIVGSSPEMLIRCEDGLVETRPIAGTRPRGADDKQDLRLAEDLLKDPKERAEHVMLVDLGRNDLGRVCRQGSVQVTQFMEVEKYSHVMHIVSNVRGQLGKGLDAIDVLKASFPAGTVSGAPKIRAMEIIDRLENVSRGPYAGCIGYFSFSGNLDTCITIRTVVATKGKAYIQAGAGIVADSQPKKEYEETVNKAKALVAAVKAAHQQFI